MKNNTYRFLLTIICGITLFSCNKIPENSSTASLSSSIENSNYVKDNEGFYILEDSFYQNNRIEQDKTLKESKVILTSAPKGATLYSQIKMFIGGNQVDLYNVKTNLSQTWTPDASSRMNNSVGIFQLEGKAKISLQTNFAILNECTIRPLNANIVPEIDEQKRVITFIISKPGQYTIELRSQRTIHLFVDKIIDYSTYKDAPNTLYFGPGLYNKENCSYIDLNNYITAASNQTIVLDYGAIIYGGVSAYNKQNIKVIGGGIFDGSVFERNATNKTALIPLDFNYCNEITFDGVSFLDPAGWCFNLYFCKNITINNCKIISSRSNGDGISLQSCEDANVSHCFLRTWDDSLVIKNYPHWNQSNVLGQTKNITLAYCLVWTDLAQSLEIGFETYGEVLEHIKFENITILHNLHKAIISIHNGNNASIKDISYENITVEDASMRDSNNLIEFSTAYSSTWSNGHGTTSLGSIDGVTVNNVLVLTGNDKIGVSILGAIDPRDEYNHTKHYISNITITNISIKNTILSLEYSNLYTNELVNNLTISNNNQNIIGATYFDSQTNSDEYGLNITIIK